MLIGNAFCGLAISGGALYGGNAPPLNLPRPGRSRACSVLVPMHAGSDEGKLRPDEAAHVVSFVTKDALLLVFRQAGWGRLASRQAAFQRKEAAGPNP